MSTTKILNSYDDTKRMLNKIRQIQEATKPSYGVMKEQTEPEDSRGPLTDPYGYGAGTKKPIPRSVNTPQPQASQETSDDFAVINDVEVEIHSEDPEDLQLNDEEKGKISQLIDDFRAEVSETVEFDKLHIYETSAKLSGKIGEVGLIFTLSTGDDTGLYINGQMLKIDDRSLDAINKLKVFELKFANSINDLLVRRRTT